MPHARVRTAARLVAVLAGATLPLFTAGVASADLPPLPNPPSLPPLPNVPQPGQLITVVVNPPSLVTAAAPPAPGTCVFDTSYDNTPATPPGSVFRGQSMCGAGVYAPVLSGQARLLDIFGTVIATGNSYQQTWGLATSQGEYVVQGSTGGVTSSGPVPGLDYTISYDTSITLTWPQHWTSAPAGCSLNGQTLQCVATSTFNYLPGTQGGQTPG